MTAIIAFSIDRHIWVPKDYAGGGGGGCWCLHVHADDSEPFSVENPKSNGAGLGLRMMPSGVFRALRACAHTSCIVWYGFFFIA